MFIFSRLDGMLKNHKNSGESQWGRRVKEGRLAREQRELEGQSEKESVV
jgi:hypothetical protein